MTSKTKGDPDVDYAESDSWFHGRKVVKTLGRVIAEEVVNAVAIVTVGYMAANGVEGIIPYAAVAAIAIGAKYITIKRGADM